MFRFFVLEHRCVIHYTFSLFKMFTSKPGTHTACQNPLGVSTVLSLCVRFWGLQGFMLGALSYYNSFSGLQGLRSRNWNHCKYWRNRVAEFSDWAAVWSNGVRFQACCAPLPVVQTEPPVQDGFRWLCLRDGREAGSYVFREWCLVWYRDNFAFTLHAINWTI
jgi:hypothetical protein